MPRILGVDFGTRRVGLAISDPARRIASPLEIRERRDETQDARYYLKMIEEEAVAKILVGLPVHTTGREGEKAGQARKYGDWLAKITTLPVQYWDERFTTADAEKYLLDAGLTKKQRTARLDMVAAQIMLQSYLDAGCPDAAKIFPWISHF